MLYHLFEAIRADKRLVTAGTGEYLLLREFLEQEQEVHPLKTFEDLLFICEKLWLKNKAEEQPFREVFHKWRSEIEKYILDQYTSLNKLKEAEQKKLHPEENDSLISKETPDNQIQTAPADIKESSHKREPAKQELDSTTESATTAASSEDETEGELSFSIGSEQTSADTVTRPVSPDFKPAMVASSKTFLFGDEYFPVANRYLRQNWRNLKSSQEVKEYTAIDFINTTNRIAQTGFFTEFEYEKRIENLVSLFIFIDHGGSMDACEAFGNELANSAWQSTLHSNKTAFYFYNLPERKGEEDDTDYIFSNEQKTLTYSAANLFANLNKKNIVTLIYSDAGAFRGTIDETTPMRVEETKSFLKFLLKKTANTVWINPAPKTRWKKTAAEGISQAFAEVPMFEATATGIEQAVNALKGKMSVYH